MLREGVEDHAVVDESVCGRGLRLERRSNQTQGLSRSALLVIQHATEMERVKVARITR